MAPGAADPANFDIEKCATQRNALRPRQAAGAQDGRAVCGARGADRARADQPLLPDCLETARFAFGEARAEFAPLDPLPADEAARKAQLDGPAGVFADYSGSGNWCSSPIGENIQALTGQRAAGGRGA